MIRSILAFIERRQLLEYGQTLVVGVSGGADSLCLLHLLTRVQSQYALTLHVAHLNHCLRGSEADDDAVFVATLAADWGLSATIRIVNVANVAQQQQLSIEQAARQVRYRFLAQVAQRSSTQSIAVGHNADDQSETVLMHLLRGSGLAGLRGMQAKSNLGYQADQNPCQVIRPLLTTPHSEIKVYCHKHNLRPRFDHSNLDTRLLRNRLRHELLPTLQSYNPNIRQSLRRLAQIVTADYELLESGRDQAWQQIIKGASPQQITFDLNAWRSLALGLQRATLRQAIYQLVPNLPNLEFTHIEQAIKIASSGSTGAQATLPQGLRLFVDYTNLHITRTDRIAKTPDWPLLSHNEALPIALPRRTNLPNQDWCIHAAWLDTWDNERILKNKDPWSAFLDAAKLTGRLILRTRKSSDRFCPLGLQGRSIDLGDFMVNAKIPRRWRDQIPLLVLQKDTEEQILWVGGWRLDERVKITPQTSKIAHFRFSRLACWQKEHEQL